MSEAKTPNQEQNHQEQEHKKLLEKMHQATMPKIKTYQEYKTAFSMAMVQIIHLEQNYPNFKQQMQVERLEHAKRQ